LVRNEGKERCTGQSSFLDTFLGVFGDFGGGGDRLFHNTGDIGDLMVLVSETRGKNRTYREEMVLFSVFSHLLFSD